MQEPGYHPQVEAISPTPEDRTVERDDVKSTKDDLLQKISKVDREIAKAESQIAKLKKKQVKKSDRLKGLSYLTGFHHHIHLLKDYPLNLQFTSQLL